jgi:hypothetical protein
LFRATTNGKAIEAQLRFAEDSATLRRMTWRRIILLLAIGIAIGLIVSFRSS